MEPSATARSAEARGTYNANGTITLKNTSVPNSPAGDRSGGAAVTSGGYNLSGDGSCAFGPIGYKQNTDPNPWPPSLQRRANTSPTPSRTAAPDH